MRVPVRVALVLAAVSSVAACGSVAAPEVSGPHAHTGGTWLVPARPGPPAGSRGEASALARLMLSRLRLPPGARRLPPAPGPPLVRRTDLWAGAAASLDLDQLFVLRQPMDAVAAVVVAHAPAGMTWDSTGEMSGAADRLRPVDVTSIEAGYTAWPVPAGIYAAQLVLTLVATRSGGSLVRADAQVIWFPPPAAAEYIDPGRYHVLTITVTTFGPQQHPVHKVVTSQAAIARLARALNSSPVQPVLIANCPMIFADYRLAFAVSRHSRPAVVVSATQNPCEGAQIRAAGRRQPPLEDEGTVVAIADQLLGVTPGP
jgi:hypothetical protein